VVIYVRRSLLVSLFPLTFLLMLASQLVIVPISATPHEASTSAPAEGMQVRSRGMVVMLLGVPDIENLRASCDIWITVQFWHNVSYTALLAAIQGSVDIPAVIVNKTQAGLYAGHSSGIAYLSSSREAFPFDSYLTNVTITIYDVVLNDTETSVYWRAPGFEDSASSRLVVEKGGYYTDISIQRQIDRDPRWLPPIVMIMALSPFVIVATIPLARVGRRQSISDIQPRIFLALTATTVALALFQTFRNLVALPSRGGFFTFPELMSVAAIACGAVYLTMTLLWWSTGHGKLIDYDTLSSVIAAIIVFGLLSMLVGYLELYNPPYAARGLLSSISFVYWMEFFTLVIVLGPVWVRLFSRLRSRRGLSHELEPASLSVKLLDTETQVSQIPTAPFEPAEQKTSTTMKRKPTQKRKMIQAKRRKSGIHA